MESNRLLMAIRVIWIIEFDFIAGYKFYDECRNRIGKQLGCQSSDELLISLEAPSLCVKKRSNGIDLP